MKNINFSVKDVKNSIRKLGENYLRHSIELNGLSEYVEDLNLSESEQQELYDELEKRSDLDVFEDYKYKADFLDLGSSEHSEVENWLADALNSDDFSGELFQALFSLMDSADCSNKEDDDICISSEAIFNALFKVFSEKYETSITDFIDCFTDKAKIDEYEDIEYNAIFSTKIFEQLNLFYKTLRGKGLNVDKTINTIHDFYESVFDYMANTEFKIHYDSDSDFGYMSSMVYAIDEESFKSLGFGEYIEQFKLNSLEVIGYILTFLKYYIDLEVEVEDDNTLLSTIVLRSKVLDVEPYCLEDFKELSFQDLAFKNGKWLYKANQNLYSKYGLDIKH